MAGAESKHFLTDCSHKRIVSASIKINLKTSSDQTTGVNIDTSSVAVDADTSFAAVRVDAASKFLSSAEGSGRDVIFVSLLPVGSSGRTMCPTSISSITRCNRDTRRQNIADFRAVARFGLGSLPVRPWLDHLDLGVRVDYEANV